jgi:hypothetical protein
MTAKASLGLLSTIAATSSLLVLAVMLFSSPLSVGPVGVTIWFIGFFVAISSVSAVAMWWLAALLRPKVQESARLAAASRRGLMIGGYAAVLLGLSSLSQLNLRDTLLLFMLLALVEFYFMMRG